MKKKRKTMTQYFYNQNDEQKGPINLENLKSLITSKEINSNTLIWREGFEDWKKASQVDEIKGLFIIPPPIKKETNIPNNQKEVHSPPPVKKKKRRGRFLLWLIPLLIIGGIGIMFLMEKNQQMERESEKRFERISPETHLRVDNVNNKVNLLLDDVIKGTITNTADRTTYGEIELLLTWYDKKDKVVSKKNYTVNKSVSPFGSVEFKIKDTSPFKARKYFLQVTDAKVIKQY